MRTTIPNILLVVCFYAAGAVFLPVSPVLAQSADGIPPAAVRDLRVNGVGDVTYARGFFIPTHFSITDSVAGILNQKFDVMIIGTEANQSLLDPLRTSLVAGPSMLYSNSLAYPDDWAVIDSHEDWFLHSSQEASPQTRIPLSGPYYYQFYMNVGSQGWRDFVVGKYAAVSSMSPTADGVFVDGVAMPSEYETLLGSAYPSYDASGYESEALDFIYAVKDAAAGKLVLVNSELSKAFTLAADGGLCEGFVHFGGQNNDTQITRNQWLRHLALIGDRDLDGSILLVGSGSADSTLASVVEYCYASFLLGYNPHAYCCFYWYTTGNHEDVRINWFPVWEMDIGEPTGSFYEADGVYRRDFTRGTVIANPNDSGSPIAVNLGAVYTDSSGNNVSTVTLPSKSGVVLKKNSW